MQKVSRHRLATYTARELANGTASSSLAQQIAAYLVDNKLTHQTDLLLRDVNSVMAKDYGVVFVEVTSARTLTAEVKDALIEYVQTTDKAKTVELTELIDESLIGGIVMRTPEALFDSSIRTKLRHLSNIKQTRSK